MGVLGECAHVGLKALPLTHCFSHNLSSFASASCLTTAPKHIQAVSAEFRGGAASRLLRGSLVASLPGLTFQQASAETMGESKAVGGGGGAAAGGAPSPPPGGNVPRAVAVAAAAAAGAGLGGGSSPEPGSKDNLLSGQNSVGKCVHVLQGWWWLVAGRHTSATCMFVGGLEN